MKKNNESGFTLIEGIIAIGIIAVISLALSSVMSVYYRTSSLTVGQLNNVAHGSKVLNRIAQEVKYAESVTNPVNDPRSLTFKLFKENSSSTYDERIYLNNGNLYINNKDQNGQDQLIASNVKDIQFSLDEDDTKLKTVFVKVTLYDPKAKDDYVVNSKIKLLN